MTVRRSASLIIFNSNSRTILLMQRPLKGTFASAYVFPGGAYESTDTSPEFTALRETFEETGLLIHPDLESPICCKPDIPYTEALKQNSVDLSKSSVPANYRLIHMSSWTTPPPQGKTTASMGITKRFETDFYLYQTDGKSHDLSQKFPSLIPPTSETLALQWLTAKDALAQFSLGKIKLMPPQWYILNSILESCNSVGDLSKAIDKLSNRIFKPKIAEKKSNGQVLFDWGHDEYGLVTFANKSITDIQLLKGRL